MTSFRMSPKALQTLDISAAAEDAADVGMETGEHEEDEEVVIIDSDITFTMNKSHASQPDSGKL